MARIREAARKHVLRIDRSAPGDVHAGEHRPVRWHISQSKPGTTPYPTSAGGAEPPESLRSRETENRGRSPDHRFPQRRRPAWKGSL